MATPHTPNYDVRSVQGQLTRLLIVEGHAHRRTQYTLNRLVKLREGEFITHQQLDDIVTRAYEAASVAEAEDSDPLGAR